MACLNMGDSRQAPRYSIPARRLGALEHPLIIKDVDRAIKTFGPGPTLEAILDSASPQISVPLYIRPDNPTVRPLTSHNALSHNVVLKVTVPKRTGRKRKRGSNGQFEGETTSGNGVFDEIFSRARADAPKVLRRKLLDNVDRYKVEPIGVIRNTHRYRGFADFQYSLGSSSFITRFVEKVLPGDVQLIKEFTLRPGIDSGSHIDLIPPPNFTPMTLPFNYNYSQNPYTKELSPGASSPGGSVSEDQEYSRVINVTSRIPAAGYFIAHDEYPVPSGPSREPDMSDPQVALIMTEMRRAMEERPIWTRRSMWNRLASKFTSLPKSGSLVRHCLQYAGYQFKGGPWRDALVKYGLDPRTDPKYRIYQTLIFKLHKTRVGTIGRSWQAVRRNELGVTNFSRYWKQLGTENETPPDTYIFDGRTFSTDGKVWQVCDITDPLLARLFANAEVRAEVDLEISGFYHRVIWSVAKAIMKCKMLAIRFGRTLTNDDFSATLEAVKGPNDGGDGGGGTSIGISLPDLQLTKKECEQIRGRKEKPGIRQGRRDRWEEKRKRTHYRVRIPLKESEAREAEKMIRLLSTTMNGPSGPGGSRANSLPSGPLPLEPIADKEAEPVLEPEKDRPANPGTEMAIENDTEKEQAEDEDEGAFQMILDDLDEDDSDDDDDEEDEDDDEDERSEMEEEEDEEEEEEGEGDVEEDQGSISRDEGRGGNQAGQRAKGRQHQPTASERGKANVRRSKIDVEEERPSRYYDEDDVSAGEEDYDGTGDSGEEEDFDPSDMAFGQ